MATSGSRPRRPPLVSIVVLSYNYVRYLGDAIESALAQTYAPTEIIVVDDGSTDRSPAIIAGFGERVIPVYKSNGGETTAINAGFARSSGEIVMFVDSDDMLKPTAVEEVVAAWRSNTSKVQFALDVIDAEGRLQRKKLLVYPPRFSPSDVRNLIRRCASYSAPPTSGNAYARDYLTRVMPLDAVAIPFGPDSALNAIAPLYGDVLTLDRVLGSYRLHGRNMSRIFELDADAMRLPVDNARRINALLRTHALAVGWKIPRTDPLNMYVLERRLALSKLLPNGASAH